ncbi:MAG: major facilitator superfamily 1 [Bacteroidetes bacterium]|nr:major facilitator superfamily 1 [Bacteroidota bacterium]
MRTVRGVRWWIITLIGIATVINYIDRNSLTVMWSSISGDLGLHKEQLALIISAFMIAYAVGQGVSGRIFDWLGTRVSFVITIVMWSVSCGLHSLAQGLLSFSLVRALLGFSEAGNWPGATKSNAEWFPAKERAFAQGIFNAGASLGAVLSAPVIAGLYILIGWRLTFVAVAVLGLLWVIPWWIVNRARPEEHPWLTPEEREHILGGRVAADEQRGGEERMLSVRELLSYKQSWSVIASRFFIDPIWWLFVNWLPIYLAESFGFDAAGSLFGGWLSGHLIHRGWTVNAARKWTIVLGGVIMAPLLVVSAFASEPLIAVLEIAVALFGYQIVINNIQTLPSDFFSGKSVGTLAGLGGTSAVAGVLITTWLVPAITQTSYVLFFFLAALLVPVGTLMVFVFAGKIHRLPLRP